MAEDSTLPKISYNKKVPVSAQVYSHNTGNAARYNNFTPAGRGGVYSRYGLNPQSSHSSISPSLEHYSQQPSQFIPQQNNYSRYLSFSSNNFLTGYTQNRWGQSEPTTPTSVKHVQFIINSANAHLYYKFITDPNTGIPHQERIVSGELQRVLVGTDILDWVMSNLDGANSVEQAQVVGSQLLLCDLIEDVTDKDNKKFTSGPNCFYRICDKHKEKPVPVDPPPPEENEPDKHKKFSFFCTLF